MVNNLTAGGHAATTGAPPGSAAELIRTGRDYWRDRSGGQVGEWAGAIRRKSERLWLAATVSAQSSRVHMA